MSNKDNKTKIKVDNDEVFNTVFKFIIFTLVSSFFGYCGYTYCIENYYNVFKGIVFGALLPMILYFIDERFGLGFIKFIILVIAWICICEYIPLFIGIIALVSMVSYGIWKIIDTYNNRTVTETITVYENKENKINNAKIVTNYSTKVGDTYKKHNDNNYINIELDDYKYYCERCDKRISEEEYIENCGLCEDCDAEVYFGERYDGDDYDMWR